MAHNAFFEQVVTRFVLTKYLGARMLSDIPIYRWECTASMAAALALPRSLEKACLALSLPIKKDMDGRRLVLKYCKPRKPTKNNPNRWHDNRDEIDKIIKYCALDVDAMAGLYGALPALKPSEREVWLLNQKINMRGFHVDKRLIDVVLCLIEKEIRELDRETQILTNGAIESTTQRGAILNFVNTFGANLTDLTASTIKSALLRTDLHPTARRILEIRQDVSKTSTAKYEAFKARSAFDNRIRDHIMYHGASTGRDAGQGVQPHNLPSSSISGLESAFGIVAENDLELIRLIYGSPMRVFSSCIRGMIIPTPGYEFFCEDFSAIEARVLLWLADDTAGLDIFRKGIDPYKRLASLIFNTRISEITSKQRDLGKRAELGCGFGMGWEKFLTTCFSNGLTDIDETLAKKAVSGFRELHRPVVKMWSNIERAAIRAVQNPGRAFKIHKTKWYVKNKTLFCELPSGRALAYYDPVIKYANTPWGDRAPKLYHWSVDSFTKKWALGGTYGGKLAENVTQAAARDVMKEAERRVQSAEYDVLFSVHDEILSEREIGAGSASEYSALMQVVPNWACDLPIKTEGWQGMRYRK